MASAKSLRAFPKGCMKNGRNYGYSRWPMGCTLYSGKDHGKDDDNLANEQLDQGHKYSPG
jgi:hypothetical protein